MKPKTKRCPDCGKLICDTSSHCAKCFYKHRSKKRKSTPPNYCVDCGKRINRRATRCTECFAEFRKVRLEKTCPFCGDTFEVIPSAYDRIVSCGKPECKTAALKARPPRKSPLHKRVCPICGQVDYDTNKERLGKTCGKPECIRQRQIQNGNKLYREGKVPIQEPEMVTITCPVCGTQVEKRAAYVRTRPNTTCGNPECVSEIKSRLMQRRMEEEPDWHPLSDPEVLERHVKWLKEQHTNGTLAWPGGAPPTPHEESIMDEMCNLGFDSHTHVSVIDSPLDLSVNYYVPDFIHSEARLIVEIDGSSHNNRQEYDDLRDKALAKEGWVTLRFTNEQVENDASSVITEIKTHIAPNQT